MKRFLIRQMLFSKTIGISLLAGIMLAGALIACEPVDRKAGYYQTERRARATSPYAGSFDRQRTPNPEKKQGTLSQDSPASQKAEIEHETRYSTPEERGTSGTYEETH